MSPRAFGLRIFSRLAFLPLGKHRLLADNILFSYLGVRRAFEVCVRYLRDSLLQSEVSADTPRGVRGHCLLSSCSRPLALAFTASTISVYLIFFLSGVVFHRAAALGSVSVSRFEALLGHRLVMNYLN